MHKILRLIGILGIVLLFTARVEVYAQPIINGITPDIGVNNGTISVTITGSGFSSGATVSLAQAGISIIGSPTTIIESNTIMTTFDLTDAPIGSMSVVVTNPDNESGILSDGFNILPIPPNLSFMIAATKTVSPGGPQQPGVTLTYTIVCTNIWAGTGTGTATEVKVTDQIPDGTKLVIDSMVFVGTPPNGSSVMVSHDGGQTYDSYYTEPTTHGRWTIPTILPGETVAMEFKVVIQP